jgi:hypothetical protein
VHLWEVVKAPMGGGLVSGDSSRLVRAPCGQASDQNHVFVQVNIYAIDMTTCLSWVLLLLESQQQDVAMTTWP